LSRGDGSSPSSFATMEPDRCASFHGSAVRPRRRVRPPNVSSPAVTRANTCRNKEDAGGEAGGRGS
jgi:hypothetical protein